MFCLFKTNCYRFYMEPKLIDGIQVNDVFTPVDGAEYQVLKESTQGGRTYVLLKESKESSLFSAAAGAPVASEKRENQMYVLKDSLALQSLFTRTLSPFDSEAEESMFSPNASSSPSNSETSPGMSEDLPSAPSSPSKLSPPPETLRSGRDPVAEVLSKPGEPSLFYGLTSMRHVTLVRLREAGDALRDLSSQRTIDEYNHDIGINDMMMAPYKCLTGLFELREKLRHPEEWKASPDISGNARLISWIDMLVANKEKIGLEDFGAQQQGGFFGLFGFGTTQGAAKIMDKNHLTKNLPEDLQGSFTAQELNSFLKLDQTEQSAEKEMERLDPDKGYAIGKWIQTQFFRRTSKLGIDFAVNKLGGQIHFNTAGAIDHTSDDLDKSRVTAGGVAKSAKLDQKIGRSITVSELKHIDKAIREGKISPSSVNKYDEFRPEKS